MNLRCKNLRQQLNQKIEINILSEGHRDIPHLPWNAQRRAVFLGVPVKNAWLAWDPGHTEWTQVEVHSFHRKRKFAILTGKGHEIQERLRDWSKLEKFEVTLSDY